MSVDTPGKAVGETQANSAENPRPPVKPPEALRDAATSDAARAPVKPPEGDKTESAAATAITVATPEQKKEPEKKKNSFWAPIDREWTKFVDGIRKVTPAILINEGSRIHFALKAAADGFGVASGMKKGSGTPERTAANVITFATLIPGAMFKEKPESKEDAEKYKKMNPLQYAFTKVIQAADPKNHIAELVGVATIINGILTARSGFRQSAAGALSKEIWQGLLTSVAGAALTFIPDREKAFQISTSIFLWRIPFKYAQAHQAYFHGYPKAKDGPIPSGDWYQFANFGLQQAANVFGLFFTGIKKMPDGTIVRIGKDEKNLTDKDKAALNKISSVTGKHAADKGSGSDPFAQNAPQPQITAVAEHKAPEQGQQVSS